MSLWECIFICFITSISISNFLFVSMTLLNFASAGSDLYSESPCYFWQNPRFFASQSTICYHY